MLRILRKAVAWLRLDAARPDTTLLEDDGEGDDVAEGGAPATAVFATLRPFVLRQWRTAALLGALTLVRAACLGAVIFLLNSSLGALLPASGERDYNGFALATSLLLACQLLAAVAHYLAEEVQRRLLEAVEVDLFQWAVEHLVLLPADYFRRANLVKFVMHLDKLQTAVRAILTAGITFATRLAAILAIVAAIIPQAPWQALLGLSTLALLAFVTWRRTYRLRTLAKQEFALDVGFIDRLLGIVSNMRDLRNLGLRERALEEFDDACGGLARRALMVARVQQGAGLWLSGAGIVVLGLLVATTAYAGNGLATGLTCFAALGLILEPLSEMVQVRTAMQTKVVRLGELFHVIERLAQRSQHTGSQAVLQPVHTIRFENVNYVLRKTTILHDLSFELRQGEIVGLIGRSGAGKSTLAYLALRLADPTTGGIFLNDHDGFELDLESYWQQCGLVVQVPCRVGGTIAEEIELVQPHAARTAIAHAATSAGIDQELLDRALDVDDALDEGGQTAWHSRGLRQRTEWARLWLREPRVLVLDEPTSLADPGHEQRFLQELVRRKADRITLLISHRPATLSACDRLLVLDKGRLVDQGPAALLLARWLPEITEREAQAS